jgi:hypothetical protein
MFKILFILILIILVVSNIVFVYLWNHCKNKDNFCSADHPSGDCCGTCQGMDTKVFTNRPLLHKLYNEGKVTENTRFIRNGVGKKTSNF